jgi:hypothetical protein
MHAGCARLAWLTCFCICQQQQRIKSHGAINLVHLQCTACGPGARSPIFSALSAMDDAFDGDGGWGELELYPPAPSITVKPARLELLVSRTVHLTGQVLLQCAWVAAA